ncbi:caspase domain protein [Ancylostoma caninum]|uniref:Caspase domain protein n=1 Tax=Ancylostoma caninum TaxID=29170 RepID=A0A368G2Q5_ANCCA|nr:caspase domain protein [Ancylostoma caninum]
MTSLDTNLADLSLKTTQLLSNCLTSGDLWLKIVDTNRNNIYYMSEDEVERIGREANPGESVLRAWSNRGQSVRDLLVRLQTLSKRHGAAMDQAQLILSRKFKPVRWAKTDEIVASIVGDNSVVRLQCKAVGFPCPVYHWYKDEELMENASGCTVDVVRCKCSSELIFRCVVSNEIEDGHVYSEFYRKPGKEYSSRITSQTISLAPFVGEEYRCENCRNGNLESLREIMASMNNSSDEKATVPPAPERDDGQLVAADKVALIISNCMYQHLPKLVTPHCDAETLATALQDLKYKTVTLADLTLAEMKFVIKEYKKLLGNGVYAVFYFVGHGFEVNGQCYLLPVEAPSEAHKPEHCLSMDLVLHELSDHNPALNLLLLDVCRKFIPFEFISAFVEYAEPFKIKHRPNRNTVYGYSTSGGVGAYEIKGEMNGVFMKYLKTHLHQPVSVIQMINDTLRDIEGDEKVCDVQVPELRSTLTRPRSLTDPLVWDGHTVSFDHHTIHWRLMHELPNPVHVRFDELALTVTIWFDFCGHFTNKVYVFSSVGDLVDDTTEEFEDRRLSEKALSHIAYLSFPPELDASKERLVSDDDEGVSLCLLLSHLQRSKGELRCTILLRSTLDQEVVATREVGIGHVLITRIEMLK